MVSNLREVYFIMSHPPECQNAAASRRPVVQVEASVLSDA
jgi:hypothetical protein